MNYQEFYLRTVHQNIDIDGAYGGQCWDLMAKFCQMVGVPLSVIHCGITGYVKDIWNLRYKSGILDYFNEVPVSKIQNGDWVIWDTNYSMTPKSHVAMYYNGLSYGQTVNKGTYLLPLDFSKAMGAFRWKGWETMDNFRCGYNTRTFDGVELDIYKAYDGYDLFLLSAGVGKLKTLDAFDDPDLLIIAATNAGYFQMRTDQADPYGTHYGIEQSYNGVDIKLAPNGEGLIAYSQHKDGSFQLVEANEYYTDYNDVQFGITPYSVVVHNGVATKYRSTALSNKEAVLNEQTMIARVNDHWFFICTKNKTYPDTMKKYALSIGATEAFLMDSGGSTQLMGYTDGAYNKIHYTGRAIANAFVLAKVKTHNDQVIEHPNEQPVADHGNEEEPVKEDHTTENPEVTGLFGLTNKTYDILKWVALVGMPAFIVFLTSIMDIWQLGHAKEIIGTLAALNVLLGAMLGVSSLEYAKRVGGGDE